MNDGRVAELLEELTPDYEDRSGDWKAVQHDARQRRLRRWPLRMGLGFAVVVAVAVAVLAWPFQAQQGGVLERALAAIGDGPVLHVVLRGEWGGTLVDLNTGERQPIHGENELWYDSQRGLLRSISRLGDVVMREEVSEPKEPPAEVTALAQDYRQALESGSARIAVEGSVDGDPVVWVTIRREMLPDVADGRDHEWAQQVAVSRSTFKPVALRQTRDGKPGPQTGQRVLELELLPAGAGDFTKSAADTGEPEAYSESRDPITLEQARATLGQPPLWLGREYAGLPLAQVFVVTTRSGRQQEIRLTGEDARAAEACSKLRGEDGGRCFRELGQSSIEVRPDGIFTFGPIVWGEVRRGVMLFYGTVGDDPSTYRADHVPLWDRPHVTITEASQPSPFPRGVGAYVPPSGSVLIGAAGAGSGVLQVGGIDVSIEAPDKEAVLAAARSLRPMPN